MSKAKIVKSEINRTTPYITGVMVIHAEGGFLNGAGLGTGEDRNKSIVKTYWRNKHIPYVSSQAWRRWLRNTLIEETGYPQSEVEAVAWNKEGNTSKVAGQLDPITYVEDDVFGYMFAKSKPRKKEEKEEKEDQMKRRLPEVQLVRTSPFKSSILRGVADLVHLAEDEGYVHLKNDTPLPYTTQFYSGELTALFGLEVFRIGVFEKKGKISEELDPYLVKEHKTELENLTHPIYAKGTLVKRNNLHEYQNTVTGNVLKAIARLRGGSKLTQFGVDVSPRLLIMAGIKTGNLLFDDLLVSVEGKPALNIEALKEIVSDYSEYFTTPIHIGLRAGYLSNEAEIKALSLIKSVQIIHGTPIEIATLLGNDLK